MTKCRYADQYKALRAPLCGCDVCERKWALAQRKRAEDLVKDLKLSVPETRRALHIQATTGDDGRLQPKSAMEEIVEGVLVAIYSLIVLAVAAMLIFLYLGIWPNQ